MRNWRTGYSGYPRGSRDTGASRNPRDTRYHRIDRSKMRSMRSGYPRDTMSKMRYWRSRDTRYSGYQR